MIQPTASRIAAAAINPNSPPSSAAMSSSEAIQPGQQPFVLLTHQRLGVTGSLVGGRRELFEPGIQLPLHQEARQLHDTEVGAEHQADAEQEYEDDEDHRTHYRTSTTPSNMSGGR
jgi:hypothetical protein